MHQLDIAEDVAIAYGYDKFEPTVPNVPTNGVPLERNDYYYAIRQIMTGIGFQEVVTLTLSNLEDEFDKMNARRQPVAETLNAVTPECNICRRDVLPSLMDVLAQNQHREYPQRIFEVGDTIIIDAKSETGAKNVKKLAAAIADTRVSYAQLSSVLDAFMNNIGAAYKLQPAKHPTFIEGRSASIIVNNKDVGIIGEIHPKVLNNWNLEMPVAVFEVNVDKF
jgi:phenylalanyl-tRNA synthetase beta chain